MKVHLNEFQILESSLLHIDVIFVCTWCGVLSIMAQVGPWFQLQRVYAIQGDGVAVPVWRIGQPIVDGEELGR
jgi:hypothetical protein